MSNPHRRSAEEILASLEDNTPDELLVAHDDDGGEGSTELAALNAPSPEVMTDDAEKEHAFIIAEAKALLEKQKEAIDLCMDVARGSEHPRAFEVLGGLIADGTKMAHMMMQLHEKRRKLNIRKGASAKGLVPSTTNNGTVNNNNVFVGSTTELQKFMHQRNQDVKDAAAATEDDDDDAVVVVDV